MISLYWVSGFLFIVSAACMLVAHRKNKRSGLPLSAITFGLLGLVQLFLAATTDASLRPQLDVKNVGTTPLTLSHKSGQISISPGVTGSFRVSRGDSLTVYAGKKPEGPSIVIPLDKDGTRLHADVKADEQGRLSFEFSEPK